MSHREILEPYLGQRVYLTGIVTHIDEPSERTKFKYNLVVTSICMPNEDIEIDHAVIAVSRKFFDEHKPALFQKYGFTASIASYIKPKMLLGIKVNSKAYDFREINKNKWSKLPLERTPTLSIYLERKIQTFVKQTHITGYAALKRTLLNKTEGQRERHIDDMEQQIHHMTKTANLTKKDVVSVLYKSIQSTPHRYHKK